MLNVRVHFADSQPVDVADLRRVLVNGAAVAEPIPEHVDPAAGPLVFVGAKQTIVVRGGEARFLVFSSEA